MRSPCLSYLLGYRKWLVLESPNHVSRYCKARLRQVGGVLMRTVERPPRLWMAKTSDVEIRKLGKGVTNNLGHQIIRERSARCSPEPEI